MDARYQPILEKALPYLRKGKKKDLVVHTQGVIYAMELLLKAEEGDPALLYPSAILHDVGWSAVPVDLQTTTDKQNARKGMELHLSESVPIVKKILRDLNYQQKEIQRISDIIVSHKYKRPRNINKQLLIDADTLSDIFKEQFYTDAKAYCVTVQRMLSIRSDNQFYTQTAKVIFMREYKSRQVEVNK